MAGYFQECEELHSKVTKIPGRGSSRSHSSSTESKSEGWQRGWLIGFFQNSYFFSCQKCLLVFQAQQSTFLGQAENRGWQVPSGVDKLASKRLETQFLVWWHSGTKVMLKYLFQIAFWSNRCKVLSSKAKKWKLLLYSKAHISPTERQIW